MFADTIQEKISLFLRKGKAEQLVILFSAYLLIYLLFRGMKHYPLLSTPLVLVVVSVTVFFREYLFKPWFWLVAALLIALRIYFNWHDASNHDYVISYVCIVLLLTYLQVPAEREVFLKTQVSYVFALVLFLAGLQKALSPDYLNGNVLDFMLHVGQFAPGILNHDLLFGVGIKANYEALLGFGKKFSDSASVLPWTSPFFHAIARYLAWLIILSEMVVGILALRFFDHPFYHVIVLALITGIFFSSPEGGFLSLLLILAWSRLPNKLGTVHWVCLFGLLLSLTLIIQRIAAI